LTNEDLATLKSATRLKTLSLNEEHVTPYVLATLSQLKTLEDLQLHFWHFDEEGQKGRATPVACFRSDPPLIRSSLANAPSLWMPQVLEYELGAVCSRRRPNAHRRDGARERTSWRVQVVERRRELILGHCRGCASFLRRCDDIRSFGRQRGNCLGKALVDPRREAHPPVAVSQPLHRAGALSAEHVRELMTDVAPHSTQVAVSWIRRRRLQGHQRELRHVEWSEQRGRRYVSIERATRSFVRRIDDHVQLTAQTVVQQLLDRCQRARQQLCGHCVRSTVAPERCTTARYRLVASWDVIRLGRAPAVGRYHYGHGIVVGLRCQPSGSGSPPRS